MPIENQNNTLAPKSATNWRIEAVLLLLLTAAGIAVFSSQFTTVQPAARFNIEAGRSEAVRLAESELRDLGWPVNNIRLKNVSFRSSPRWAAFLQTEATNPSSLTGFRPEAWWDVILEESSKDGYIRVLVSPSGQVFSVEHPVENDEVGANLSSDQAQVIAAAFILDRTGLSLEEWSFLDAKTNQHADRSDHTLTWRRAIPGDPEAFLTVSMVVAGDAVRSWSQGVALSDSFRERFDPTRANRTIFGFGLFVLITVIWLAALVLFAIRFRSGEIGVRNGFMMAFILILVSIWFTFTTASYGVHVAVVQADSTTQSAVVYLGLGLQIFFSSMALFFVWNAGDSVTREVSAPKLRTFDQLLSHRFFSRGIGLGLLRGFALGAAGIGLTYGLVSFVPDTEWSIAGDQDLMLLSSVTVFGIPLAASVLSAVLSVAYVYLFGLGGLKLRFGRTWPAVVLTTLAIGFFSSEDSHLNDQLLSMALAIPSALLFIYFYLRYDLWTVFTGVLVSSLLGNGALLLAHPAFESAGMVSMGILVAIAGYGIVASVRGSEITSTEISPPYVRFISERQRLKLELDIARQAQLRMLPSSVPQAVGLEVAAFSEPATEVGGDYYDFMEFPDGRLGVVVGDVSGKGMPAALYMTMLKGYLQSRSETDSSPLSALAHVNRMFSQSSDRSMFATMAYCVLDVQESRMTFARAGHCPILVYRPSNSSTFVLQPAGIGIGLERSDLFERVTVQDSMDLRAGDTVVMYSDGLTEARDAGGDEFGQDRLMEVLQAGGGSAENVLGQIRAAHAAFVGDSSPHDDLTCVVVRLTP